MKKYFLTTVLLFLLASCFAQDTYFVTVVKGTAFKADGSAIKPGTKLLLADKVNLGSKESVLILLHPAKGRFVVSSQNAKATADNKFVILVKDFLELHAKNVRLSSRAIDEAPVSLEAYFKTDPAINNKFLVIDTLRVKLPGRTYTNVDNKVNFFFLQLVAAKPVNHKLLVRDKTLLITREDLVFNNTLYSRSAGELNLGYLENYTTDKKTRLIVAIEVAFMSKEECIDIMRGIRQAMSGAPDNEILKEIYTQIYQMYGKPDEQKLIDMYNRL
ncbi:MAG: hypothetical protein IPL84_04485 [Chitinophagaceae bacterium]|nr:hypothetical protein [Chitinophagaceae bacterium]